MLWRGEKEFKFDDTWDEREPKKGELFVWVIMSRFSI